MPASSRTRFIDDKNREKYFQQVHDWLKADFEHEGRPSNHFWHNIGIISGCFDENNALVLVNQSDQVLGYMIWTPSQNRTIVDIVEIKKRYQRQGLFKKMLADYLKRFPDVLVLTAFVLDQSRSCFEHLGWERGGERFYFKIIKPFLRPSPVLSEGLVIGVCQSRYYDVDGKEASYAANMRYFRVHLNQNKELSVPIITRLELQSYVAIYFNRQKIAAERVRHLFKDAPHATEVGLFILPKLLLLREEDRRCFERLKIYQDPSVLVASTPPRQTNKRKVPSLGFFSQEKREKRNPEDPHAGPRPGYV